MENKELSAKRASSMRRNSFEQTLPSEVREIIDRVMPRSETEHAAAGTAGKAAAFAATAMTAAQPAAPAPEPKSAAPRQSGMNWGGEAPKSAAPVLSRPIKTVEPAARPYTPEKPVTPPRPAAPIIEQEPEEASGGSFKKIAVIVAALAACAAIGIIAALKFSKKPEKAPKSSEISTAELSSEDTDSSNTTTTASAQAANSDTTEAHSDTESTTASAETTTTTEATTTVTETEPTTTTAATTTTAPVTTETEPQVTFSIPGDSKSAICQNDKQWYSWKWKDEKDHGRGVQSVTWMITVSGRTTSNVYITVEKNAVVNGTIKDPQGVFAGFENEKMALKANIEPILTEILNRTRDELADPNFSITQLANGTDPVSNHWDNNYYTDWVITAQQKALNDANYFLRASILGK